MTIYRPSLLVTCLGASALAVSLCACSGDSKTISTGSSTPSAVLAGSYVFTATGTDATDGDYAVLGSFTATSTGQITSATVDYNLGSGIDSNVTLTGYYVASGTTATITLVTADNTFSDSFTTVLGSVSGAVTNFDGTGSGTVYQQTTTGFSPAGTYKYLLTGEQDGTVTGSGNFVAATGGTFTSGSSTYTDGDTTLTASTATGFLYAPQSSGRGQGSLQGNDLAYYVVSPSQILAIGLDARALLQVTATKS